MKHEQRCRQAGRCDGAGNGRARGSRRDHRGVERALRPDGGRFGPRPGAHPTLDDAALDRLFREARTHNSWTTSRSPTTTLRALYDLLKFGPTSANSSPARFVFLRTPGGARRSCGRRCRPATWTRRMAAPVTVIVAYDPKFYEQLPPPVPARRRAQPGSPATTRWRARPRSATARCRAPI